MKLGLSLGRIILQLVVFFGVCYSFLTKFPKFAAPPTRFRQSAVINPTNLRGTDTAIWLARVEENVDESDIDPDDPYSEGFENQKEWLALFPKKREPEILREYPDFASLEPNDPLFLDMPWPTRAGPEASAFGKHMQWRRGLSDGESKQAKSPSFDDVVLSFSLVISRY